LNKAERIIASYDGLTFKMQLGSFSDRDSRKKKLEKSYIESFGKERNKKHHILRKTNDMKIVLTK